MRELSLFTGAGGGVLGTQHLLGWQAVGYVEWDAYCQQVLKARIQDGFLHYAPIFGDIREFIASGCAAEFAGMVDVVSAGFPCQGFSVAGKRLGETDHRNMWPATIECIRLVRPRFCFLENVPGLLSSGYFGRILGDLADIGFCVKWNVFPAHQFGAPHVGKRLWIVAQANSERCLPQSSVFVGKPSKGLLKTELWATTERSVCGRILPKTDLDVFRVGDGMADNLDAIKAVGNGQVPAMAAGAWNLLTEL